MYCSHRPLSCSSFFDCSFLQGKCEPVVVANIHHQVELIEHFSRSEQAAPTHGLECCTRHKQVSEVALFHCFYIVTTKYLKDTLSSSWSVQHIRYYVCAVKEYQAKTICAVAPCAVLLYLPFQRWKTNKTWNYKKVCWHPVWTETCTWAVSWVTQEYFR